MTERETEAFVRDGFVRIAGAVRADLVERCRAELWRATGCDPDDPGTWTDPVVRLGAFATEPFRAAADGPLLRAAFDRLVGSGRWVPRQGLGTFPVRFPSTAPPGDDGWHLEAGYTGAAGEYRVNLRSRGRALLMLFLFSDVGEDDAPTRIRVGSHLDVPRLLAAAGEEGRPWFEVCEDAVSASAAREVTTATGTAGDVLLCHPFLVHAAQAHRGRVPRFMAQPPLDPRGLLDLSGDAPTPVERAVLMGLA
ncbi:phytanoyl-CoA dioxygenase family protein [Streptomyces sp. NBC_01497]|uniref:phytanoyl-CoA dioxygenase family protein n=1 Tax=Streptomyces sp. NBC_01497 TaxID=2903885 RepID=UPI002E2ECA84|nr:phytanoyl-CoA dioxygenase family protein [Streptomyces sp. NBC_01497]